MSKVSVIIPVYNHAREVRKTTTALFAQTFKDFEIIAINDGSEDNSLEVLRSLNGLRVINIPHSGAAAARNKGAAEAKGEYLFFLDADIVLEPNALEKFVSALKQDRDVAFAYSSFYFGWKKFGELEWNTKRLRKNNFIHTTSLIRKEIFPGFDESLKKFQDWDLWLNIIKKGGRGVWIPEVLFKISTRKNGISQWLPKFAYKFPWLKAVREYKQAADIIKKKHSL